MMTMEELYARHPKLIGATQSRQIVREIHEKELYVGPVNPMVVHVDPTTTVEEAAGIKQTFAEILPAVKILITGDPMPPAREPQPGDEDKVLEGHFEESHPAK
jgi:hypothetical protein